MMIALAALLLVAAPKFPALEVARNAQDRPALQRLVTDAGAAASKQSNDPAAWYRLAIAQSYAAEVALELRDKNEAKMFAEEGIRAAEKAVALKGEVAEHHRVLGTLCGQIIPANTWLGIKYGRCALDSINKAIELDPGSALAWLSRGVGNYYLPQQLGGGIDKAVQDFSKAVELDAGLAEAHLWKGIALRKSNQNLEARAEFQKALTLNPQRSWIKQQLDKTPVK